jgi:UDP-N-acetylmuramate--alanine ligase
MTGLVTPVEPVPLSELGRVHFVGIGGAGMSAIARIMLARDVVVSGSDSGPSAALDDLAARGARVYVGQAADQVGDADTVVVSSAIRDTNPELAEARKRGLRVVHRAGALASLMFGRRVTAVTGTHGKTTVTSMITTILLETGAGPAYAIGGVLAATGVNAADGPGADFVAEADESDGSFLMYSPWVAVVTNVEADHLDNYGTEQAYRASFEAFVGRIKPDGVLVTSADDPGARDLTAYARERGIRIVTFGESPEADYRVTDVTASGMTTTFTVTGADNSNRRASADTDSPSLNDRERRAAGNSGPRPFIQEKISLGVPGHHYALNAAAAFVAAVELGADPGLAAGAFARYLGAGRRLEPKGEAAGVRVLDTYAHHPTELAADLRAVRAVVSAPAGSGAGRVIAVFQPHLYSRTRIFAAEFGAALGLADIAVVLDVYAAREDPEPGVTGKLVADAIPGDRTHYVPEFAAVPQVVAALAAPGDLVLTMGAGDITTMGPLILDELSATSRQ